MEPSKMGFPFPGNSTGLESDFQDAWSAINFYSEYRNEDFVFPENLFSFP
jgi:hypothetical protein